jgi:F-type H+-transporting ATPase subunit delta
MDLAEEAKTLEKIEVDLANLRSMVESSADLAAFIQSPLVSRVSQESALAALAEKAQFQPLTKNFLGVLAQNRRVNKIGDVIRAFFQELSRRRGEVVVNVKTAQDMSPAQIRALQDTLSKSMGAAVIINAKVEPSILGGMIVTVGSHMIDDSVARKLERLKAAMSRQSNENLLASAERA